MVYVYMTEEMLKVHMARIIEGKTVAVSGAGNVAIYAIQKAQQLGAKVVTCSDSTGWIYDPEGIDVALVERSKGSKTCTSDRVCCSKTRAQNIMKEQQAYGLLNVI